MTEHPAARPYQVAGRHWLAGRDRAFLGDEAGLGKSRQLVEAVDAWDGRETLVVAPAMVLDGGTWTDETQRWATRPETFTQVAYTGLVQRKERRVLPKAKPEYDRPWSSIILDEAHFIKGRKTSWTQALLTLSRRADRLYLATGTPIPNWAEELFVPLQMLYPEETRPGARFGSYWRWVETWFRVGPSRFGGPNAREIGDLLACSPRCLERPPHDPCDHYREFIIENLGDRFLMRLRDDVLTDLPPLTEIEIECRMTSAQDRAYREMKAEYVASLTDDNELVAWNAGGRATFLDRIGTGLGVALSTVEEIDPDRLIRDSAKMDRLAYDLNARSRPTLVIAHYQATCDAAAEVASRAGARVERIDGRTPKHQRLHAVRNFQKGRADVLVGSLETVAEGLTLTAADMVIFVEKSFKPSRNQQALRRIHRLGQDRPVTALDYVSCTARGGKTVDTNKRELLAHKTDRAIRYITAAQYAGLL